MTAIVYDGKRLVTDSMGIVGTNERHMALSKPVKKIRSYGAKFRDVLDAEYEVRMLVGVAGQQSKVDTVMSMVKKRMLFEILPGLRIMNHPDSEIGRKWFDGPTTPEQQDGLKTNDGLVFLRIDGPDLSKNMMFILAEGELVEVDEPCWAIGFSVPYFIMGMRLGHDVVELMAHIAGKYDGVSDNFAVYDIEQEFEKIELESFQPYAELVFERMNENDLANKKAADYINKTRLGYDRGSEKIPVVVEPPSWSTRLASKIRSVFHKLV